MNRHEAREQAFILTFEKLFNKENDIDSLIEMGINASLFEKNDFSRSLALTADEKSEELDAIIAANSIGWSVHRLPRVTLAILRLSICEILYFDEVPLSVSINEAVEFAKTYATKEDASFINGILGTVAKGIQQ